MKTIILDTNILITDPSVLTQKTDNLSLVIPIGVRDELISISGRSHKFRSILNLISGGVNNGIIQIDDAGIPTNLPQSKLSFTDLQTIALALKYKNQGTDVVIATLDREIQYMAQIKGIQFIDLEQLRAEISGGSIPDQKNYDEAEKYKKRQWIFLLLNFTVGIAASILANVAWKHIELIYSTISIWGTILFLLIFPIFLYWFRARRRIIYGVAEFAFGIIMAAKVFYPDFDYTELKIVSFLQIIAGIYVMVRGMDNFGKGIKNTRFEHLWNNFANESKK